MIFDEWERRYLARRKEFDAWAARLMDSSAENAETDRTTAAKTEPVEMAPGATANTVKVWWLYPNRYMVLIGGTLYLTDNKGLKDWMRTRFGAWRIDS